MPKFRNKPVVIEAIQFVSGNAEKVIQFIEDDAVLYQIEEHEYAIDIPTLEGTMTASEGDWIIKGVAGEVYPCKPDIFDATYEEV